MERLTHNKIFKLENLRDTLKARRFAKKIRQNNPLSETKRKTEKHIRTAHKAEKGF